MHFHFVMSTRVWLWNK